MIGSVALGLYLAALQTQSDNFPDVPDQAWAYRIVATLNRQNVAAGFPDLPRGGMPRGSYWLPSAIYAGTYRLVRARKTWERDAALLSKSADPRATANLRRSLREALRTLIVGAQNEPEIDRLFRTFSKDLSGLGLDVEPFRREVHASLRGVYRLTIPTPGTGTERRKAR